MFRSLGWRSVVLHARLRRQWPRLAARVPRRGGRVHLARDVAGDLRGVPVTILPVGREPGADAAARQDVPAASGDGGSPDATPGGRARSRAHRGMGGDRGGLDTARRRRGSPMLVLGWWGIARDNSMGNDEVATRWAALLPLRELAHLLGNVDAVHGLYYLLMHSWVALGSSPGCCASRR